MDTIVLGTSVHSFVLFILAHAFILVCFKDRFLRILIKLLCVGAFVYNVYICQMFGVEVIFLSSVMLSLFILVYHFTICHIIFGTSLYARLITLLDEKGAATLDEIIEQYDSKRLLDCHLKHLLAHKEIQADNQTYSLVSPRKPLFLITSIKQSLTELVKIPS